MKKFKDFILEDTSKTMSFVFGRFNPPTTGHEKLFDKLRAVSGNGPFRIYASQSQDPKKNPLNFDTKIKYLRKMFPKFARSIMGDKDIRNVFDISVKLYDQGFTQINMVAGSDRVAEFETLLNKYNGVRARHGFYQFEKIEVISAGERDPDAEGVAGMSASKMRAAVAANDINTFRKGLPTSFREVSDLFNDLRSGMGLSEDATKRSHVKLEPVSEEREAYVSGDLFQLGDEVIIKESGDIGIITHLGSNYVIVESEGKKNRKWLNDVEVIEKLEKDEDDPCWDGYVKLGTKTKNGKEVPNCVPKEENGSKLKAKLKNKNDTLSQETYERFKSILSKGNKK